MVCLEPRDAAANLAVDVSSPTVTAFVRAELDLRAGLSQLITCRLGHCDGDEVLW